MLYNHKTFFILSLGLLLIFSTKNSFAQYPGMGAFRAQQSQQFVNQQMQMQMQMNSIALAGQGDIYEVTFKDSSVKKVTSYFYTDTILNKEYLLFVDKKFPKSDSIHRYKKIYPEQTLYISTIRDNASKVETYGVPKDSCWMFKVVNGAINVYAKYYEVYDSQFNYPRAIIAIQLGDDGPMINYNIINLKQMVAQDSEALDCIENKKYHKAIKVYNRNAKKAAKK